MPLMELGKTPVSESRPAGGDVRLDPDFEALAAEIEKLSSPSGAGGLDWQKVVALSSGILANKSKDMLVVCYLSFGLLQTDGLEGLAKGVGVLRDTLENFWEDLYPSRKRMKGRKNAIDWWMEKVRAGITGMGTEKWSGDKKNRLIENLKAIDEFLGANMEDAPVTALLIKNIDAMIEVEAAGDEKPAVEQSLSPQEPSRSVEKTSENISGTARPAAETEKPKEVFAEIDADKLLRQGLDILGRAALTISREDPLNALLFRLNRAVAWISVTSLPPSTDRRTLLPPPDEQILNVLSTLYRSENWKDLLQAAESRVATHLFWIDLSRYTAESLEKLGCRAVSEAVAAETVLYVKRLPGVEKLAFSDGTPFANEETREWLKNISGRAGREGGTAGGPAENDLEKSIAAETASALELVKANKLPEALNAFRGKLSQAPSARERFMWQIGFCRLLNQMKQTRISGPYLRELLDHVDIYKIEQWEPALAVEALITVLSGLRLQQGAEEGLVKSVVDRITTLDPASALDLII